MLQQAAVEDDRALLIHSSLSKMKRAVRKEVVLIVDRNRRRKEVRHDLTFIKVSVQSAVGPLSSFSHVVEAKTFTWPAAVWAEIVVGGPNAVLSALNTSVP